MFRQKAVAQAPPSPCLWTKDINGRSLVESAAWHLGSLPTSPHTLRAEKLVSLSPRPCPAPAVTLPLCTGGRRRGCLELRREVRAASLGCSWDGRQEAWRGACTSRGGTPALGQRTCSNSGSAVKLPAVLGWALTPSDYWMTPISNLIYLLPWACMTTYSL